MAKLRNRLFRRKDGRCGRRLRVEARSRAGDIITDQEFNRLLRWEWRIPKDANNGVKYFITEKRKEAIGHEYQMVNDRDIKDPREKTASFYDVLPPKVDATKPAGEWNQSRVLVQGKIMWSIG